MDGDGLTVIAALPELVPEPLASLTEVTVYVIVEVGLTVRVAGLALTASGELSSDHCTLHGPVPVRSAWMVAGLPPQMVVLSALRTVAVGGGGGGPAVV